MRLSDGDKKFLSDFISEKVSDIIANKLAEKLAEQGKLVEDAVAAAVKPLTTEIEKLHSALTDSQDQFKALQNKLIEKTEKVTELEKKVIHVTQQNIKLQSIIHEKADESEQYSRKDSLRINGIAVQNGETNESLQTAFIEKLREYNVEIDKSDIFRMHRAGRAHPINNLKKHLNNCDKRNLEINPADKTETAEIIVRFSNWRSRSSVYSVKYNKSADILVKCDLTKYRQDLLAEARAHLKDHQLKGYVYNNAECRLVLNDAAVNEKFYFDNRNKFEELCESLLVDANFHKRHAQK